jgi:WD40 repeat protein
MLSLLNMGIFCGDKPQQVLSLPDLCFERCKADLTDTEVSFNNTLNPVFQSLQQNKHRDELFQLLQTNKHPEVAAKIDHYTQQYRKNPFDLKGLNINNQSLLELWCKKTAFGTYYTDIRTNLPIPFEGDWQKTSLKAAQDGTIFLLTMPIEGPDNYSSQHRFVSSKKIAICSPATLQSNPLSSRYYDVKNELYREQNKVYQGEPFYNPGGDKAYKSKGHWLKQHELTNCLDTFPNNSLVVTHTWGGIELHKEKNIEQFIIGNSISSVCCASDNKHIALGSYDGTVTVIDITQENYQTPQLHESFKKYFGKAHRREKHPLVISSCKLPENRPITTVKYSPDGKKVLFCSGKSLYCTDTTTEKPVPSCLFTVENQIKFFTQVENMIACVLQDKDQEKDCDTLIIINEQSKQISSIKHSSCINSICSYSNNDHHYIITGDMQGNVIIWNIGKTELIINMLLEHNFPVHTVEVTKDNQHIAIKITEDAVDKRYNFKYKKDNVIFYPTPHTLQTCAEKQLEEITNISALFEEKNNDPKELYKILSDHQLTLYTKKNKDLINLKDTIENRIIEILAEQSFIASITDIYKLIDLLNSFPCTNLTKPTVLHLSGMNSVEKLNLLANIESKIEKALKDIAPSILLKQLEKDPNHPTNQQNVHNVTYKLFFEYGFPNCREDLLKNPDSSDLKTLILKLDPIRERLQEEENPTPWHTRITSFITRNQRPLIAAAISIPLAYGIYKYFTDNK